jgi:hypothetical protein
MAIAALLSFPGICCQTLVCVMTIRAIALAGNVSGMVEMHGFFFLAALLDNDLIRLSSPSHSQQQKSR